MTSPVGILALGFYQPDWLVLPNSWFERRGIINKKFVRNTGIEQRFISDADEVTMAEKAVRNLADSRDLDLNRCAAVFFVTNSSDPLGPMIDSPVVKGQAIEMASRLGMELPESAFIGINFTCSGYPAAFHYMLEALPRLELDPDNFILIITSNRVSSIIDFGCLTTGALFGDYCAATCVVPMESCYSVPKFQILDAFSGFVGPMPAAYNKFVAKDALFPNPTAAPPNDHRIIRDKVCSWLDGMGIGENAPRLMLEAIKESIIRTGATLDSIGGYVPHQAGQRIVEWLTEMLESKLPGKVYNGYIRKTGNTSSTSIPLVLAKEWDNLKGRIFCPTAGAGNPSCPVMSQGCLALQVV